MSTQLPPDLGKRPDIAIVLGLVLVAALYDEGQTVEDVAAHYKIEPSQMTAFGETFAAHFVDSLRLAPSRKEGAKDLDAELERARLKLAAADARFLQQLRRARQG